MKLRKFKKLHLLNLEGNPASRESEYRSQVLAYLIDLKYLDYAMVVQSEVVAAREQYQDELLDVEEKEVWFVSAFRWDAQLKSAEQHLMYLPLAGFGRGESGARGCSPTAHSRTQGTHPSTHPRTTSSPHMLDNDTLHSRPYLNPGSKLSSS